MNKQFIITNFAAFALMLFLPTGCRQADGKQDAVQSYRVIKVAASPVEISESYSAAIRGRGRVKTPNINKKTRCTFLCGCTTSFCFSTKKSLINNLYGVIWVK